MILVAMKSTIYSTYEPPAANAAGRAVAKNKRGDSVVSKRGGQQRFPAPKGQRNPLKRLDSDKEIQENPKAFLWLFMDFPGRTGLEQRHCAKTQRSEEMGSSGEAAGDTHGKQSALEALFKPVIGVRVVIETGDFQKPFFPVESVGLLQRSVG